MEYDKEFEEWFGSWWMSGVFYSTRLAKDATWYAWQAARKDHYRIGEEVEARQIGVQWKKGTVMAVVYNDYYIEEPELVRRIPAKSSIDEIAEEAVDKYQRGAVGAGSLTDIIKAAILKDREERGANR